MSIPKYASLATGKTDANGSAVFYSTVEDQDIPDDDEALKLLMFNGRWKMHETVF